MKMITDGGESVRQQSKGKMKSTKSPSTLKYPSYYIHIAPYSPYIKLLFWVTMIHSGIIFHGIFFHENLRAPPPNTHPPQEIIT